MKCFVTGASGFIGASLVRELIARGHRVTALVRPDANGHGGNGAECERVGAALHDRAALAKAMRGCDWCFHTAGNYNLWLPDYAPMYDTNIEGTRSVLEAAAQAGCARIVYTSTSGCIGLPPQLNGIVTPADESAPVSEAQMINHYKRSKWRGELVARELAGQGRPVIIVNPTGPAGPGDRRPTPTGQVILDFLNRRLPAYLSTGLNWVHVRDVAVGHILAAERGRLGERYILGNAEGNWTMKEWLDVLAEITGLPAPRWRAPYSLAWLAAQVSERVSSVTGRPPRVPLSGVRMARSKMFFSPAKAVRELGLPQTSPKQALADAVEWFRVNGYVKQ